MTKDDKAILIEALTYAIKEISYWHRDASSRANTCTRKTRAGSTPTASCVPLER